MPKWIADCSLIFFNPMRARLLFSIIFCVAASAHARLTSLFNGAVTFQLPSSWQVQREGRHGSAQIIQLLIPDSATDNTAESSNAVITAEPLQPGLSVKSFGDSGLQKPYTTVLTDISAGKNWRTVLSHAQLGKTGYAELDRLGVDAGYMVCLRVAFPIVPRANARWMRQVVADCNSVVRSLKIRGKNVVTSELREDNGVVWLRDLKDPAKTFDWEKGWHGSSKELQRPKQAQHR
jgi:hypothetical protein